MQQIVQATVQATASIFLAILLLFYGAMQLRDAWHVETRTTNKLIIGALSLSLCVPLIWFAVQKLSEAS